MKKKKKLICLLKLKKQDELIIREKAKKYKNMCRYGSDSSDST